MIVYISSWNKPHATWEQSWKYMLKNAINDLKCHVIELDM